MRHWRNFTWFALGFALALWAGVALGATNEAPSGPKYHPEVYELEKSLASVPDWQNVILVSPSGEPVRAVAVMTLDCGDRWMWPAFSKGAALMVLNMYKGKVSRQEFVSFMASENGEDTAMKAGEFWDGCTGKGLL